MEKKPWKLIYKIQFRDTHQCIKFLKKKNYQLSPWIINIFRNNKKYSKYKLPKIFYRIKVVELGFKKPVQLHKIYKKIKKKGYSLIDPSIALYIRTIYNEQKKGEWLRFATPMNGMIDGDGVPHLPKLGKALNLFFIETYWSYKNAIFHPHNEFIVQGK
jgi:hypothetical protein